MNCDLDIIGVTRTECECFDADPEESENLSGLYLSELEGMSLQLLFDHEICEYGTWRQHCEKAIYNAKAQLHGDIVQELVNSSYYEKTKPVFGQVGHDRFVKNVNTSKTHLVYRVVLNNLRNTTVTIKNVGLYFQNATVLTANIYNVFGTLISTKSLTPVAGKYIVRAFNVDLSCDMPGVQYPEYFIVINIDKNKPVELKHVCCGDQYKFDYERPCFREKKNVMGWRSVAMVGYDLLNWNVNNISDYRKLCPSYKTFAGLVLDVSTRCDTMSMICNEEIDYKTDDLGIGIALALRYKAGSMLFTDLLNRPNVELKAPESMLAALKMWDDKYKSHIKLIVTGDTLLQYTDCFKLRNRMVRAGGRL